MFLPQQADYIDGASIILVDYPAALEHQAKADANGVATVEFDPVDSPFLWRVERMTTYLSDQAPPAGATCLVYEGPTLLPMRIRDGSSSPALDIADESSPITLQPTNQLIIQWTGLRPNTVASVSVQIQLWRRVIAGS
ncbi:hypothetical protein OG762_52400 (plasmid) [Streptomyces sp. NBC_01136]|uniref:hypothetical protein n=1 Tax=Streptomyces sp. NBC_01136 TaxID=2903754 RepID=UPI0037DC6391|nr:hypothetical protein OG762_52400 [Streptomyces sp. NBC_01136]